MLMAQYDRITFHYLWSQTETRPTVQRNVSNYGSTHRVKMPVVPELFVALNHFPLFNFFFPFQSLA